MPDLASSAVTLIKEELFAGPGHKNWAMKRVRLNVSAQGGTTNQIPASALGFAELHGCTNGYNAGSNLVVLATIGGNAVRLADLNQATDANRANPADMTISQLEIVVWGNLS